MSNKPKILALAGSTRENSYNKKLVKIAVQGALAAGAEVTLIDLRDYPMPLYDGDLEAKAGVPDIARKLRTQMSEHDGFLIASPEYNSSLSGHFKNAIDWVSRPEKDVPSLLAFRGKLAAIMSASPGPLGGLRGLVHLRDILENIFVMVIPDQVTISSAQEAFSENEIKDLKQQTAVLALGEKLTNLLFKLKAQ